MEVVSCFNTNSSNVDAVVEDEQELYAGDGTVDAYVVVRGVDVQGRVVLLPRRVGCRVLARGR